MAATRSSVGDLLDVELRGVAAEPEHDDAVGDGLDVGHVVADQDDAEARSRAAARSRLSTSAVWATPRAAVGSSSMTTLGLPTRLRAMATVWRWPPERDAIGMRTLGDLGREGAQQPPGLLLHARPRR